MEGLINNINIPKLYSNSPRLNNLVVILGQINLLSSKCFFESIGNGNLGPYDKSDIPQHFRNIFADNLYLKF
jgi:hypothetical protein